MLKDVKMNPLFVIVYLQKQVIIMLINYHEGQDWRRSRQRIYVL